MTDPTELAARFPEINPRNYDHEDVVRLNEWGIEAAAAIEELARDAWISVNDRLPDGSFVLAFVDDGKGHTRRIRAFYAAKFAVESGPDDEASDYCEEKDEFYLTEGWYEANEYEETHWFVHDPVTHWMPLPKPPAAIDAAQAKEG